MTIGRTIKYLLLGGLAVAVAGAVADLATFDRKAWVEDYGRLKAGMARDYANLDWIVDHRGLDPAALDRQTTARLQSAYSHIQAYFILKNFIRTFGDPHLHVAWGDAPPQAVAAPMTTARKARDASGDRLAVGGPAVASCDAAGYQNDDSTTDLAYPGVKGWQSVDSAYFPAGVIGEFGILRIAHFGENKYVDACDVAYRDGMDARKLQLATRGVLNADLAKTIARLKAAGAQRMIVDVTRNGGGSEWSREVARAFAAGRLTRYKAAMPDPGCDRKGLWSGKQVCRAYRWPPEQDVMDGLGLWDGPLFLLIDRGSASATEEFAVWLRDNDKALLVGSKTWGAGCGFVDGGRAVQFEAAPIHVMMPNCARFTKDGRNEIEGLEADIAIDWADIGAERFLTLLKMFD